MHRLGSFAVGVALFAVAGVATAKEVWRDPGVFEQNRLPARSIMVPCESAKTALAVAKGEKPRTESKWLQSLNGDWGFKWKHDFYAKEWEKTAKIAVPGCWQLQGEYDPALYTNVTYPIHGWNEGDPYVEPPKDYTSHYYRNPVGLYSRTFRLPPSWSNRRTVIHFGGVSSAMYVRLNGKEIGCLKAGEKECPELPRSFCFETVYVPGELEAVSYTGGKEISRAALKTAGNPAKLRLTPETKTMKEVTTNEYSPSRSHS